MDNQGQVSPKDNEISLRLDRYNDIYSDFDIRPYASRALSVDFMDEIKRAAADKQSGRFDLVLHMPAKLRKEADEKTIIDRLSGHFRKHHRLLAEEKTQTIRTGLKMVVVGVLCMIAATLILYRQSVSSFWWSFLVVFLEPAAWFLLWEGMNLIIFGPKKIKSGLEFYRKMSDLKGHIRFQSY